MMNPQQLDLVEYIAALRAAAPAPQQARPPSSHPVQAERPVRGGEGATA